MIETVSFNRYYTCIDSMASIFDKRYRKNGFSGPYEKNPFEEWQKRARSILMSDLRINDFIAAIGSCEIDSTISEKTGIGEGIVREKVLLTIKEWSTIPMYVLKPKSPKGVFICLAGHHSTGKFMTSGNMICTATAKLTEKYGAGFGLELARRNYIAICPDSIGFGERREKPEQGDSPEKWFFRDFDGRRKIRN